MLWLMNKFSTELCQKSMCLQLCNHHLVILKSACQYTHSDQSFCCLSKDLSSQLALEDWLRTDDCRVRSITTSFGTHFQNYIFRHSENYVNSTCLKIRHFILTFRKKELVNCIQKDKLGSVQLHFSKIISSTRNSHRFPQTYTECAL